MYVNVKLDFYTFRRMSLSLVLLHSVLAKYNVEKVHECRRRDCRMLERVWAKVHKSVTKHPGSASISCWHFHVTTSWFLRLCVCNTGGGGLRGRIPDTRCGQDTSSQQEVPLLISALPALGLRAGHAPGPASILCGWPGVHGADTRLRWHHHSDGWRVSQVPLSGIYP